MSAPPSVAELEAEIARLTLRLAEAERHAQEAQGAQQRARGFIAAISTTARRSAESTPGKAEYATHLDGRIGAIQRAQSTAMRAPFGTVDLHQLIAEELLAHAAVEGGQLHVAGPAVRLAGRAVAVLWLAIHELAVNSVKFGALATREGRVGITWALQRSCTYALQRNGSASVQLHWTEKSGLPMAAERRAGFGTEMIEQRLARELGGTGTIDFTPAGLECRIWLPVSAEVAVVE